MEYNFHISHFTLISLMTKYQSISGVNTDTTTHLYIANELYFDWYDGKNYCQNGYTKKAIKQTSELAKKTHVEKGILRCMICLGMLVV